MLSTTVIVVANTQTVTREITYGVNVMLNGEIVQFDYDSRPFVMNGRTFLPLGTFAELLGLPVDFDPATNTAIVGDRHTVPTGQVNVETQDSADWKVALTEFLSNERFLPIFTGIYISNPYNIEPHSFHSWWGSEILHFNGEPYLIWSIDRANFYHAGQQIDNALWFNASYRWGIRPPHSFKLFSLDDTGIPVVIVNHIYFGASDAGGPVSMYKFINGTYQRVANWDFLWWMGMGEEETLSPKFFSDATGHIIAFIYEHGDDGRARDRYEYVIFANDSIEFQLAVGREDANGLNPILPLNALRDDIMASIQQNLISGHALSLEIGDLYEFGSHLWRALDVQDGKVLLLSEFLIERMRQGNIQDLMGHEMTWETSYIRYHLNNYFFMNTFTPAEQARIAQTRVINNNNPWFDTFGGNDTIDNVFLLSLDELVKYLGDSGQLANQSHPNNDEYSFHDQYNQNRIGITISEGLLGWYDYQGGIALNWWLRSPGEHPYIYAGVQRDGNIVVGGLWAGDAMWDAGSWLGHGIRPALWLYLTN